MSETLLTWIIFILTFGGVVLLHEFGHFMAARLSKIEIEEFGIGFPTPGAFIFWTSRGHLFLRNGKRVEIPRNFRLPILWNELVDHDVKITADQVGEQLILRSIETVVFIEKNPTPGGSNASEEKGGTAEAQEKVKTTMSAKLVKAGMTMGGIAMADVISEVHPGTRFTFNWLPIGGFVRPKGENDPNVKGGMAAASPWKRLFVLFAGPTMNLLTAVIVFSIIIMQVGGIITTPAEEVYIREILITEVASNSPADRAGLQLGDVILAGNGVALNNEDEASALIKASADVPIAFTVVRNGEKIELTITPRMNEQAGRPLIGVSMCGGCEFKPVTSLAENLQYSFRMTGAQIYGLATLPVRLIAGTVPREQGRLVGLKGLFDIMGQSVANDVEASQASAASSSSNPYNKPIYTLSIIAMLSISLGIFNIFPFPALDGGRIIFVLPELIFRRRVPHQFENLVHGIGMTLLLLVMLYVNVRDFIDPAITTFP